MGETYADVVLHANGKEVKKKLLVDTGSTFSWIYSRTLRELGVRPEDEEEMETIEGRVIKRKIGELRIECLKRRSTTWVVFARKKDAEVLGLHALEGLRLEVDPRRRRLKKSRAIRAV